MATIQNNGVEGPMGIVFCCTLGPSVTPVWTWSAILGISRWVVGGVRQGARPDQWPTVRLVRLHDLRITWDPTIRYAYHIRKMHAAGKCFQTVHAHFRDDDAHIAQHLRLQWLGHRTGYRGCGAMVLVGPLLRGDNRHPYSGGAADRKRRPQRYPYRKANGHRPGYKERPTTCRAIPALEVFQHFRLCHPLCLVGQK